MAQCMSHGCLSSSVRTRHTKIMARCVSHDFLSSSVRTRHTKMMAQFVSQTVSHLLLGLDPIIILSILLLLCVICVSMLQAVRPSVVKALVWDL